MQARARLKLLRSERAKQAAQKDCALWWDQERILWEKKFREDEKKKHLKAKQDKAAIKAAKDVKRKGVIYCGAKCVKKHTHNFAPIESSTSQGVNPLFERKKAGEAFYGDKYLHSKVEGYQLTSDTRIALQNAEEARKRRQKR